MSDGRDATHTAEAPKVTAFRTKGQPAPTEARKLPAGGPAIPAVDWDALSRAFAGPRSLSPTTLGSKLVKQLSETV